MFFFSQWIIACKILKVSISLSISIDNFSCCTPIFVLAVMRISFLRGVNIFLWNCFLAFLICRNILQGRLSHSLSIISSTIPTWMLQCWLVEWSLLLLVAAQGSENRKQTQAYVTFTETPRLIMHGRDIYILEAEIDVESIVTFLTPPASFHFIFLHKK